MSFHSPFAVNGRFLAQRVTGVQRYARAVVDGLDALLAERGETAPILAPEGTPDPHLRAMPLRAAGPLSGHAWEQTVLPARFDGRLLNLCNTAPVVRRDQILCIHDANVFNARDAYSRSFRAFYGALQPLLVRRCLRIATVSAFSAGEIARHLPIEARDIAVLPNGHEHALRWDPLAARPDLVASVGAGPRPFVLALGSRARHKNLRLLTGIAPQLDALGLDLLVAGGADAVFTAEQAGQGRNVRLVGYVTDDDLAFLMQRALCLAFPSWTEGFGLPVLEAFARGCPVISSDRSSLPEVCGEAALVAAPDAPEHWLRHAAALLGSQALREDLAARGRERAGRFSWARTADGYAELLAAPATRPRTAAPRIRHADAPPRIAVVVATTRRGAVVQETVRHLLETQTLAPALTIVSGVVPEDAGDLAERPELRILTGPPGLAAQRNAALAAIPPDIEIVAFFDDDFVAHPGWLAAAASTFRDHADVAGLTGRVVADGIKGPGLSFGEAKRLLSGEAPATGEGLTEGYSPYGCNMAFRVSAIGDLRFDERLVLYGWLEDRDFGGALRRRGGRLVRSADALGVHMGSKGGRVAGDRLGYSQVVNPIYLHRKGTMSLGQVASHIGRNLASNLVRSLRSEPFVDRRGRLRGNVRGFLDLARGRLEPERALSLGTSPKGRP